MSARPVIHGGPGARTFDYQGTRYSVANHGTGWGWEVYRTRDGRAVADNFHRLADVRAWLAEYATNDWPMPVRGEQQ